MIKGLREKFRKNSGFTLIEMLIVVAIIAILIAVSIPLVGSALEKARDATDQANERSAKAEAAIMYLGAGNEKITYTSGSATLWYDAAKGKLLATNAKDIPYYGKCTGGHTTTGDYNYAASAADSKSHEKQIIKVTITEATGDIEIAWADRPTT